MHRTGGKGSELPSRFVDLPLLPTEGETSSTRTSEGLSFPLLLLLDRLPEKGRVKLKPSFWPLPLLMIVSLVFCRTPLI